MRRHHAKKNRTYTIILVPHSGQGVKQLHISAFLLKGLGLLVTSILLVSVVMGYHYSGTVRQAKAEQEELHRLREINNVQVGQIEQLAQTTATLQEDMQRISSLDNEIRKIVGTDSKDAVPVSRSSSSSRPLIYNPNGSKGGPGKRPDLQQLVRNVEQLRLEMKSREASLSKLRESITAKRASRGSVPNIWPSTGEITSGFGYRNSPWGAGRDYHPGIDIADSWGTPIYATADGIVAFAGWEGGYGNLVVIDHGNGIETAYGHNAAIYVSVGQQVSKGEQISAMGSTGASTGPHVHYEVRVSGERVNPMEYLP